MDTSFTLTLIVATILLHSQPSVSFRKPAFPADVLARQWFAVPKLQTHEASIARSPFTLHKHKAHQSPLQNDPHLHARGTLFHFSNLIAERTKYTCIYKHMYIIYSAYLF